MYNYNRDVYQAEHERAEKMLTSAGRQVPVHLRADTGKRLSQWLSKSVTGPTLASLGSLASLVRAESARRWRRASTRAAALAENAAKTLVPG